MHPLDAMADTRTLTARSTNRKTQRTGTHSHLTATSQSHRSTAEYCITHIVNCLIIIEPCLIYTLVQLRQRENTA
ncbi:hypothetical protein V8C43DRAFT_293478 [Trichoderma afarasin]